MKILFLSVLLSIIVPIICVANETTEEPISYAIPLPDPVSSALLKVAQEKKESIQNIFETAGVAFGPGSSISVDPEKHILYMKLTRPNALLVTYIICEAFDLSEKDAISYLSFDHESDVVDSVARKAEQGAAANP